MHSIGIDWGERRLRAVALEGGPAHFRVKGRFETEWEAGGDPQASRAEQLRALRECARVLSAGRGLVYVGLPLQEGILRQLTCPSGVREQLAEVVPYQVEPTLPIPLEEAVLDFELTGDDAADHVSVLAYLLGRERVAEVLAILDESGIDPVALTLDSAGLHAALPAGDPFREHEVLLDLDEGRVVLLVRKGDRLLYLRALKWGGGSVEHGVREMRRSLLSWELPSELSFSLVEDGSWGEERLAVLRDGLPGPISKVELPFDLPAPFASALGLAMLAQSGRRPVPDFRRETFSYRGKFDRVGGALIGLGLGLLLLLGALGYQGFVRWQEGSRRSEALRRWQEQTWKAFFHDQEVPVAGVLEGLREMALKLSGRDEGNVDKRVSTLDLWLELHGCLGAAPEGEVRIRKLHFTQESVTLEVEGNSPTQLLDKVEGPIAASPRFHPKATDRKEDKETGKFVWTYKIEILDRMEEGR
jgi:type II secretory pathway component PulL